MSHMEAPARERSPVEPKLISFDEAGFTGPALLDEQQPYFVYASHALTEDESQALIVRLREQFRLEGDELKASKLKKRGTWPQIVEILCDATSHKSLVVTFDKRLALAGKFFEYFFDPVLADNVGAFYSVDFHRYIMHVVHDLISDKDLDYAALAAQMQDFMRTFDPEVAPDLFAGATSGSIELKRIMQFCQGYAAQIAEGNALLKPEINEAGKWTLDLTSSALTSLVMFGWGPRYNLIRLLCDESKPLATGAGVVNSRVGKTHATQVTDGKGYQEIRANLAGPVEFGSSKTIMSIQVADLLAGMCMEVCIRGKDAPEAARNWFERHRMRTHSVEWETDYIQPNSPTVRIGREVLKELAERASKTSDPLDGIGVFIQRTRDRFLAR